MMGLTEKRRHPRTRHADAETTVTGRIRPGLPIRVVDLSEGGGLIETAARLRPGAVVELYLETPAWCARVRARVMRCAVGSLAPAQITFHGALEFDSPLVPAESVIESASSSVATPICCEGRESSGDEASDASKKR